MTTTATTAVTARGFTSRVLLAGDPTRVGMLLLHGAGPGANVAATR